MTRDELYNMIDWLDSQTSNTAVQTANFLRQIADTQPVAWMHDGFLSKNKEIIDRDEKRNLSCGFEAKPVLALYTLPLEDDTTEMINRIASQLSEADAAKRELATANRIIAALVKRLGGHAFVDGHELCDSTHYRLVCLWSNDSHGLDLMVSTTPLEDRND